MRKQICVMIEAWAYLLEEALASVVTVLVFVAAEVSKKDALKNLKDSLKDGDVEVKTSDILR